MAQTTSTLPALEEEESESSDTSDSDDEEQDLMDFWKCYLAILFCFNSLHFFEHIHIYFKVFINYFYCKIFSLEI